MRIELTPSAWKAEVLPLNYIRILERKTRFELATLALARRCSTPEPLPHVIGRGRWIRTIESSANGFTVRPLWPLGNPSTFLYLIGAGGGNSKSLRIFRSAPPLSVGLNLSLFEALLKLLITLEPFRVRFPSNNFTKLELVEGIEPPTC